MLRTINDFRLVIRCMHVLCVVAYRMRNGVLIFGSLFLSAFQAGHIPIDRVKVKTWTLNTVAVLRQHRSPQNTQLLLLITSQSQLGRVLLFLSFLFSFSYSIRYCWVRAVRLLNKFHDIKYRPRPVKCQWKRRRRRSSRNISHTLISREESCLPRIGLSHCVASQRQLLMSYEYDSLKLNEFHLGIAQFDFHNHFWTANQSPPFPSALKCGRKCGRNSKLWEQIVCFWWTLTWVWLVPSECRNWDWQIYSNK